MKYAWMLLLLLIIGCHVPEKKQKVIVTTKVDPFNFQVPDQSRTSCSVTYECNW